MWNKLLIVENIFKKEEPMEKKLIGALVLGTILLMIFTGCGTSDKNSAKQPEQKKVVAENNKWEDYVILKTTSTDYGSIYYPVIAINGVESEDIKLANAMFKDLEATALKQLAEWKTLDKQNGVKPEERKIKNIVDVGATYKDGIVSVLVKYASLDYFSPRRYSFKAVNIDTKTGRALKPEEVLKLAGYDLKNVEDSFRYFGDKSMSKSYEHMFYYQAAAKKKLPDALTIPNQNWAPQLDDMVKKFQAGPAQEGKPWDKLQAMPAVSYQGKGELLVCGEVPTMAGAGYEQAMISIGKEPKEIDSKNPNDFTGKPFRRDAHTPEEAVELVKKELKNLPNGSSLKVEATSMDFIKGKRRNRPIYVIRVYDDSSAQATGDSYWAVSVFRGRVWKQDAATNKWVTLN